MKKMTVCVLVAMVLVIAIYLREDVKLNIKFWGSGYVSGSHRPVTGRGQLTGRAPIGSKGPPREDHRATWTKVQRSDAALGVVSKNTKRTQDRRAVGVSDERCLGLVGNGSSKERSVRERLSQSQCRVGWFLRVSRTLLGFELSALFAFSDMTGLQDRMGRGKLDSTAKTARRRAP